MDRYENQPITILNLLRVKAVHADEGNLTHHYRESLHVVKKMMNLDINMIGFDWHHHLKLHGLDATTDAMWTLVGKIIICLKIYIIHRSCIARRWSNIWSITFINSRKYHRCENLPQTKWNCSSELRRFSRSYQFSMLFQQVSS
jgi:hypothetical protein